MIEIVSMRALEVLVFIITDWYALQRIFRSLEQSSTHQVIAINKLPQK